MPRLAKSLVEERENFARDCFRKGMGQDRVQDSLAGKYNGMKMAPKRLAELEVEVKLTKRHAETRQLEGVPAPIVGETAEKPTPSAEPAAVEGEETVEQAVAYSLDCSPTEAQAVVAKVRRDFRDRKPEIDLDDPHVQKVMSEHIASGKPAWGIFDL